MKIQLNQQELNAALSLASRAVPSRPTHPVLANILFNADAETQTISLTSFDLALGINCWFDATVHESGTTTLPAKLLGDIVSKLPNIPVDIEVSEEHRATLSSPSGKYQVHGVDPEEFAQLPEIAAPCIELPSALLLEGIRSTLFAASPDEHKQVLTGIHLTVSEYSVEFASTDGHRLAVATIELPDESKVESFELTIPARSLGELARAISTQSDLDTVGIRYDRGGVEFVAGDVRISSRILDGQYPAYRQLIPTNFGTQLTVDRRSLLSTLERISVLSGQRATNLIQFELDNQVLSVSAAVQDVGSSKETLEVQVIGDGLAIAFNCKYLMDSIRHLGTDEVQLQMNTPTSPVVVTPLGGDKVTHLVMPVQVRD